MLEVGRVAMFELGGRRLRGMVGQCSFYLGAGYRGVLMSRKSRAHL